MNAQQAIVSAMRKARVKRAGFDPTAEEINDGLEVMNSMLNSWSLQSLVIPFRTNEQLTLTPSVNPHTIGVGGTLNTTKPESIVAAAIYDGLDFFVDHLLSANQYQEIRSKALPGRPRRFYFEQGQTLARLYFDYVPDAAYLFKLISIKPITALAGLLTNLTLPEEYELLVTTNLAVLLAPEYGKEAPQSVMRTAVDTLHAVKNHNQSLRVPILSVDPAIARRSRRFNINVID